MAATSETVSFDEFSKIRLLEPTQFDASQKLKDECKDFTQSKLSQCASGMNLKTF